MRDIDPTSNAGDVHERRIYWLTDVGGTLFFYASDGVHGTEIWKSNGTAAGTVMVREIDPATETNIMRGAAGRSMIAYGGKAFFGIDDGVHGAELWVSDGTAGGTFLLKDLNPGPTGSVPRTFVEVNGVLVFQTWSDPADPRRFAELWRTDGTAAGTFKLNTIGIDEYNSDYLVVGNLLYFVNYNIALGNNGYYLVNISLWRTDGSVAGTQRMIRYGNFDEADQAPGFHTYMDHIGNVVYFSFDGEDGGGVELWRTDGTTAGTHRVIDLVPGSFSGRPFDITAVDDTLFFFVKDEENNDDFWVSKGTAATTEKIEDCPPGLPVIMAPHHGWLFYSFQERLSKNRRRPTHTEGWEPWLSDGTFTATYSLKREMTPFGNILLFNAGDENHDLELWRTDGTGAGTWRIKDIWPGTGWAFPRNLTQLSDGVVLFQARTPQHGIELWRTDGTTGGTWLVEDLNPGDHDSLPQAMVRLGNLMIFAARTDADGNEIWRSDGTANGTFMLRNIMPGSGSSHPFDLKRVGDRVYFAAASPDEGRELWVTDGTAGGTRMVRDLESGSASSDPLQFGEYKGMLYFVAERSGSGRELFRTDGTSAGTVLVKDIRSGSGRGSEPQKLTVANNLLFFSADDGVHGIELWVTDGTSAGTHLVKDILPNVGSTVVSSVPDSLKAFGNHLYFSANSPVNGWELWRTDGTEAGTILFKNIYTEDDMIFRSDEAVSSDPIYLTVVGNRMFFSATNSEHGKELWVTDGTPQGTVMADDIAAGIFDGYPEEMVVAGGLLYFTAQDLLGGQGIWAMPLAARNAALGWEVYE